MDNKILFFKPQVIVNPANTFIGGIGTTVNTASLLATKIGTTVDNITGFNIVGNDIEFTLTTSFYLKADAFINDSTVTYFYDNGGKITYLNYRAFRSAVNLHSIKFPNITKIISECFYGCTSLSNYYDSFVNVVDIGNICFYNCSSITNMQLPEVGLCDQDGASNIFNGMTSMHTVYAPKLKLHATISGRGINMFFGCVNLINVNVDSLNVVPQGLIQNCSKITSINLPSVATIRAGFYAFAGTTLLESISWPNLLTCTGGTYQMFVNSGILSVNLSALTTMTNFDNDTFTGMSRVTTIDIRNTTTLGSTITNNNVIRPIRVGGLNVIAKASMQTSNGGSEEGDFAYMRNNFGTTITYV